MLEVVDVVSGMMLANVSNVQPVFLITGLNPGRDLRLLVVAINKNGRSEATVMEGFTTKVAQLQVGESETSVTCVNCHMCQLSRVTCVNCHVSVTCLSRVMKLQISQSELTVTCYLSVTCH